MDNQSSFPWMESDKVLHQGWRQPWVPQAERDFITRHSEAFHWWVWLGRLTQGLEQETFRTLQSTLTDEQAVPKEALALLMCHSTPTVTPATTLGIATMLATSGIMVILQMQ